MLSRRNLMSTTMRTYFGIDVSKKHLDFAQRGVAKTERVGNNKKGIRRLVQQIAETKDPFVVVEASGGYERSVVRALAEAGVDVARVNPRRTRAFAESLGVLAKTDPIDTGVLARFGEAIQPPVFVMADAATEELNALVRRRRDLVDARSAEKNRLKQAAPRVRSNIERHIKYLDDEIESLAKEIDDVTNSHAELRSKANLLRSVKGVGPVLASTLLALLPELGGITKGQVASLVGVAPFNHESGGRERPRHIRGGREAIRSVLHMATRAAVRFNPRLNEFFQRLISSGKDKAVAYTAAAHKLLTWLNAMVSTNRPWVEAPVGQLPA